MKQGEMNKSFYDASTPDEAFQIYIGARQDLYERTKEKTIRNILLKIYGMQGLSRLNVLEIGAAGGIFTGYFMGQGASVSCVDICQTILAKNKELHPEAECVVGDATQVRVVRDRPFDLVFAKDVIEHIGDDQAFLRNMNSHLRDSGNILLSTQNSWCLNYLLQGGYHYLRGNKSWCGWDSTHVRFYSKISFERKLKATGFKPFAWFGSYYFPYRILAERLGRWAESKVFCAIEELGLCDKFPFSVLGWNIGVVAEKVRTV